MMSIEVENNSEHGAKFKMTQLEVDVTNAVVTPLDSAELTKVSQYLRQDAFDALFTHSINHLFPPIQNPHYIASYGVTLFRSCHIPILNLTA